MTPTKWDKFEYTDRDGRIHYYVAVWEREYGERIAIDCMLESYRDEILRLLTEAPAKIERLRDDNILLRRSLDTAELQARDRRDQIERLTAELAEAKRQRNIEHAACVRAEKEIDGANNNAMLYADDRNEWQGRAEQAEKELAALRERVKPLVEAARWVHDHPKAYDSYLVITDALTLWDLDKRIEP